MIIDVRQVLSSVFVGPDRKMQSGVNYNKAK